MSIDATIDTVFDTFSTIASKPRSTKFEVVGGTLRAFITVHGFPLAKTKLQESARVLCLRT